MPYNGSGTFTLPAGNPVVTGTTISSTINNNTNSDLANGLSNAVTRNGQSPPTANLPMGSFKLTGLAAGSSTGDSARYDELILKANLISPVLVTPNLGTPSAGVLTNCTGTAAGLSIGGNAATATTATNVTTNANLTGAITSVGNAASLGSFTSAQLATALTDETGSGANVFATSPTLVTPVLGTPSSGVLTNCTGTANSLNAGIGVNQTWQVVTGSRAVSTTYYNTTGKSIYVLVDGLSGSVGFNVNGNTALSGGGGTTYSFIVPDTNSYSLTANGFNRWSELR